MNNWMTVYRFLFSHKQARQKSKPAVFVFYSPSRTDRVIINKRPDELRKRTEEWNSSHFLKAVVSLHL